MEEHLSSLSRTPNCMSGDQAAALPSTLPTLTGSHLHEAGDGLDSPVCLIEGIHPGVHRAIFCLKVLWTV